MKYKTRPKGHINDTNSAPQWSNHSTFTPSSLFRADMHVTDWPIGASLGPQAPQNGLIEFDFGSACFCSLHQARDQQAQGHATPQSEAVKSPQYFRNPLDRALRMH